MIQRVGRSFHFSASHRLFECVEEGHPCSNIHGHNYEGEVVITSVNRDSDDESIPVKDFVIEFKELKEIIASVADDFDHALILHQDDQKIVDFAQENKFKIVLLPVDTTVENMTRIWAETIFNELDGRDHEFSSVKVKMYETKNCWGSSFVDCSIIGEFSSYKVVE